MARTRVKICCMASVAEAQMAMAAGADAVGLVSAMPSGPGVADDAVIREISAWAPPPLDPWLLSAREDADSLAEQMREAGVRTVQLVRHLDRGVHADLRRRLPGARIVQVVHVEDDGAIDLARAYAETADALLLDSGKPSAAVPLLGGLGQAHDWSISRRIVEAVDRPVFLAGGLNPDNVAQAIATVRPFGLDLCSGLRRNGALDRGLLAAFMQAVAAA
ncbi:phosphoribosylanthranilate isomerase [Phenylobacterium montanum]|uniref:N-(5'-phosphoribosyl)anthranilate isomerase n=1 Tax=Phenylobacterium montanum TaxID=2823693 RepID=A0A975FWA0_9CAUL|nr:phosphoribosylanthranilate isomerase [Caulobacter sp. S6]QUD86139.1 phosphoribosylanthranilate isomerase [Caulobacter sp. S6]